MPIRQLLLSLSFLIIGVQGYSQGSSNYILIYNHNLPPGARPMALPYIPNAPNRTIIVVPPNFKLDHDRLTIPEVQLPETINEVKFVYNEISSTSENMSETIEQNAKSKLINGKIAHDIEKEIIKNGCKMVARISIDQLKKWATAACFIPEPTNTTKIACAVGLAMRNKAVNNVSKKGVEKSCVFIVEEVKPKLVQITLEMKKEAENYIQELKFWIGFLNSVEGAQWFMYKLYGT